MDDEKEPTQERLDEVQDQIDHARQAAKEVEPPEESDERTYHESGEIGEEQDDQTVTPPG